MSHAKGSRRERKLARTLHMNGFAVIRAPASGSATERELPDILAGKQGTLYAIEAKSSAEKPIYVKPWEIGALRYFSGHFGATDVLAVKFDVKHGDPDHGERTTGWYFLRPSDCYTTKNGSYRVKKEFAHEHGTRLEEIENTEI